MWLLAMGTIVVIVIVKTMLSMFKMITNSYKQIANFDGPPKHWLKGHMDQVSAIANFLEYYEVSASWRFLLLSEFPWTVDDVVWFPH